MNIIVIVSDTLRRDHLRCYGNEWISTPNLDRLAEQSVIFDHAYTASFPTVPNRRDIMTGRYTFTYSKWAPLPADETVLAEELGKAGYMTMMVADNPHILENGYHYDRGFEGFEWIRGQESDRWRTSPADPFYPCEKNKLRHPPGIRFHQRALHWWQYEEDTYVARTMLEAGRWLERNYRQHDKFFLYVDTFDPHEPWDAPEWYVQKYADPNFEGARVNYPIYGPCDYLTEAELQHCQALYAAEVTLVDRWVGHLLDQIEAMNLLENTLILFTTDHGFYHGEHGLIGKTIISSEKMEMVWVPLYEEVARIPFLAYMPGVEPRRESAFVQPVDIMPTLLDLNGVQKVETAHGISLLPLLQGKRMQTRDMVVTSPSIIHKGLGGTRITVTTDEWSFICSPNSLPDRAGIDKSVDGYLHYVGIHEFPSELYLLTDDPRQQRNVIDQYPDVASDLRKQIVDFLESINTSSTYVDPWR
jgi:arylsulfatase A-like enzyme